MPIVWIIDRFYPKKNNSFIGIDTCCLAVEIMI